MKRNIITTSDGSKTIQIEEWDEQYHSKHGAIQEANHVFIKHGLSYYSENILELNKDISILEIGFGTGLNAFITLLKSENLNVNYVGVEAYPISKEETKALNYAELISFENLEIFKKLHDSSWEVQNNITSNFKLTKRKQFFSDIKDKDKFNIIYFDAFGARVQPELWTEEIFKIMYEALKLKGVLVTYSAKGSVRRAMQSVGFTVEKLEGPPGKREMLRAQKEA
ncbi:SAM-dependent methyltransferase [Flavobacteriaceae bacterium AU392]|nr:SAM-dependent methyltransferase [Flavobacteriaceae bacterium]RKM81207.1 SAM-dependent methyltransferase [Flavobacteriaceae bacterium AU392]